MATPHGLLVVDYNIAGDPVGVEITAPNAMSLGRINDLSPRLINCRLMMASSI